MKENWYDVVYEEDERGEQYPDRKILYTSQKGLKSFIEQLQIISSHKKLGRYKLEIEEMDIDYDNLFSHIEIAEKPFEEEENSKKDSDIEIWGIIALVLGIPLLALYGLVRLIMDIFF